MKKLWLGAVFALLSSHAFAGGPPTQSVVGPDGGATPTHYLSAANNNSTNVKAKNGTVYHVVAINTTSTIYYLKLYDKATAPTCGTDTPVQTYPIPHNTGAGGGLILNYTPGLGFLNGIGFCIVSGIADNSNGNAATGVAIDLGYN